MSNFVDDNLSVPDGKTFVTPIPSGQEGKYVSDTEWNDQICQYLKDIRTCYQRNGSAWSAGTYGAGSIVTRGPFLFAARASNTIDPCFDFGDLGDNAVWAINGTAPSQASGVLTLINNVTSQTANGIYKSTVAGWDKRRLIVDARIQGTADGFEFGFMDGANATNTAPSLGLAGMTGVWGVCIDTYDPINPGYFPIVNGTQDTASRVADDNAAMTMAVEAFDRWYLDLVDNGAGPGTCTMTLYRNAYPGTKIGGSTNSWRGFADDQVQLAQWTVTRPTFTNWRFVVGAHTGGAAGIFAAKRAYARYTGIEWTPIGLVPGRV